MISAKSKTVLYWLFTVICCGIMAFSAIMYFTKYEMVVSFFKQLGYPSYLIYPLATAKVLGIIAIVSNLNKWIKEWAYAGFFFDGVLAAAAHISNKDGGHIMAIALMLAVVLSRYFWKGKEVSKYNL